VAILVVLAWAAPTAAQLPEDDFLPAPLQPTGRRVPATDWIDAFDALHAELVTHYAFGEWKEIDWDGLYLSIAPRIALAQSRDDEEAYYLALREFVYSIPDAHVQLAAIDQGGLEIEERVKRAHIGGSFGFALMGLDDGSVVARYVAAGSAAATAGLVAGAEVLQFGGRPIVDALEDVSLVWAIAPPATHELRWLQRYRFIGRAAIGSTADLTFQNPGTSDPVTAELAAVDDGMEDWLATFFCEVNVPDVAYEILPSGHGYVKLTTTADTIPQADQIIAEFAAAIGHLVDQGVPGLVVDLRTNTGGFDFVAATVPGHFYTEADHYEYVSFYDPDTGTFVVDPPHTLTTEPRIPLFDGPIVAISGPCLASSGEGVAMMIQRLDRTDVVGFWGSYGSFGISGGFVEMPMGFAVYYPPGRSLDADLMIQIDSDAGLAGGVHPDIRVPLDRENFNDAFINNIDVELERAVERLFELASPQGVS